MSINSGETTDYFVNSCGMQISQEWKGNVMTVKELCEKYNISAAAVYSKMRNYPEMFEGHLVRNEREQIADMDGEAIRNLLPLAANGDNIIELLDEIKSLRENNGDDEIIRLRSTLEMLNRDNTALKNQNEILEERVCRLEKRLWEDSGKNAEKLRDMTSFPSAESSESAEE